MKTFLKGRKKIPRLIREQKKLQKKTSNDRIGMNLGEKSKSDKSTSSRRIQWSVGSVAMLIIPACTFSLGVWQTFRLQWKLNLLKNLESRLNESAIELPDNLEIKDLEKLEFRRVKVAGEFLHDREFIISPRGRFDPGNTKSLSTGSLLSDNNMSSHGGHLLTPFKLNNGKIILINRGWLPSSLFSTESRKKTNPVGNVKFDAIVRKTEKRPQFVGKNDPSHGIWYYRDLEQMANTYGTLPVLLDACYETTKPGGPIGGQTNINVRNEHLQYLTIWYSLTLITILMWVKKFRK